jgi:AraC family transcriptional regulator of adaptative response / DNA-3-methyladenine glycosylase II
VTLETESHPHTIRLAYREPLDAELLFGFFRNRLVAGVEEFAGGCYRRSVRLTHGPGVLELEPGDGYVVARFRLDDERDLDEATARSRMLLDLDADPDAVNAVLGQDELLGALVERRPGLRVPRTIDPHELAVRAVLGQQISVTGAATLAGRLVTAYGEQLTRAVGSVTHLFPGAAALAGAADEDLPMPASRQRSLRALTDALATGAVALDPGGDRADARRRLLALPGIGPWTADYIAIRALNDSDVFLATDLAIRHALTKLGQDPSPKAASALAERWRPYRSYAFQHLLVR